MYYDERLSCRQTKLYYVSIPFSIISIIIQILLSFLTVSMYYQADFINEGNDIIKKRTSFPDIIFLSSKIIINIIFAFDKEKEKEHWGILLVLCLITGFNSYVNIYFQNYENIIIKRYNTFYSLFLSWGFFCLFIENILKKMGFEGGLYLFILGLILILIYCLSYTKTYIEFMTINFNNLTESHNCLNFIKGYLQTIKERKNSRENSFLLSSFIQKTEEKCTNEKCVLKKYLSSLLKGFDSNFLLLQFSQKLFKSAINKFPKDVTLRIHYIIFLVSEFNQRRSAQKELASIKYKNNYIFLNDNFNLYRCKKYLEEYNSINNKNEFNFENNDILQSMEYKNYSKEFRKLLLKSSSLYYDFWSSLFNSHLQGTEDFKKLNDIGDELNKLIEDIDNIFKKLQEIKNNDLEIIKLYELYLKFILNDYQKFKMYHNITMNLIIDNNIINRNLDYTNFDIKLLNENDEYKYLIISANDDNRGIITNISLNCCILFGYHKHEIIGKNMNILIPELYHKIHYKVFNEYTEKTKTEFFENLSNKINYNPNILEFSSFGRNKSKYLIPLDFKMLFVQTEENDLAYIVDFSKKKLNNYNLKEDNDEKNELCCVLTDNNLIIQTFTSNCVELLGLNSKIINSNYDITSFIKQFNFDLQTFTSKNDKEMSLNEISELNSSDSSNKEDNILESINDKSVEDRLKFKKKILKTKYSRLKRITWIIDNSNRSSDFQTSVTKSKFSSFISPKHFKNKNNNNNNDIDTNKNIIEKIFLMEVKDAFISKRHVGYYFHFKKPKIINNNEFNFKKLNKNKHGIESPVIKPSFKRQSSKFLKLDLDSPINYKEYKDENNYIKKKNTLSKNNNNNLKRKNSSVNFDFENIYFKGKNENNKMFNINDIADNIDDKYTPKSNLNFFLDLDKMSFRPSKRLDSCKELYQSLKNQTIEKINIINKLQKKGKKEISSNSSSNDKSSQESYEDSNDDNNSYASSSNLTSSHTYKESSKKENLSPTNKNNRKGSVIEKNPFFYQINFIDNNKNEIRRNSNNFRKVNIEFNNGYYKVNLNKIEFVIFDFNKKSFVNINNNENKSQMEIILQKYKSRQKINISEDENYSNIFIKKYTKNIKKKETSQNEKNTTKQKTENKETFNKEKEFEKEIIYALGKKDEQKSIRIFSIVSTLITILCVFLGLFDLFFFINNYSTLKENIKLIMLSSNLKYYTNIGLYLIREKTLSSIVNKITDGKFIVPSENEIFYREIISNYTKKIFMECNSILESIFGSSLTFSKNSTYILTEMPFNIEILYDNNNIRNITTTLYVSMIQVYSSFCNLISKSENITVDDYNLYNFVHNSFNNLGRALNIQIELFVNEIYRTKKIINVNIIVNSISFFFIHILVFVFMYNSYFSIVKKKISYIEVFYGIGLPLIKSSIKKCEIFINKINQNEENSKMRNLDDDISSILSYSFTNFNNSYVESNLIKKNNNLNKNNKKKKKQIKKKSNIIDDKQSKRFRKKYIISIIFSYLYLTLILVLFIILVNKFTFSAKYIYHMQRYHNNVIELFNGFREYLFDENNILYGKDSYKYLIQKEKDFYSTNTIDINYLSSSYGKIDGLYPNFLILQEKGFCSSYISYFNSKEECENFLGGKDGILSLGFHLIISDFVEKIRNARNYMNLLLSKNILVGNLSELIDSNSNDKTYGLDKNNSLKFRMKIFNMKQTHSKLNIIFFNIILQYIHQEKNITLTSINKSLTNSHIKYIIYSLIYIILYVILFFFVWIPMIKRLNTEIYKTKNMLSIIPVQILASQPNIKELLNISTRLE